MLHGGGDFLSIVIVRLMIPAEQNGHRTWTRAEDINNKAWSRRAQGRPILIRISSHILSQIWGQRIFLTRYPAIWTLIWDHLLACLHAFSVTLFNNDQRNYNIKNLAGCATSFCFEEKEKVMPSCKGTNRKDITRNVIPCTSAFVFMSGNCFWPCYCVTLHTLKFAIMRLTLRFAF